MIGIGLIGYGYWGPNLGRNFSAQGSAVLLESVTRGRIGSSARFILIPMQR